MILQSLDEFARLPKGSLGKGPIAVMIAEDGVAVSATAAHLLGLNFRKLVLLAPAELEEANAIQAELGDRVVLVRHPTRQAETVTRAVNAAIAIAPGEWLHYCFNGEFLFFPFAESRSIGEATTFATEERRASILTYVIDLYAADLTTHPGAVSLETAYLDRSGYYAESRRNELAICWSVSSISLAVCVGGLRNMCPRPSARLIASGCSGRSPG